MKAIAAALLLAGTAQAGEFNFEDFRHGQRALGMGGAVTAYPGEPETSFYNPAGLAMLGGMRFSGSMHFLGFEKRTLQASLRDGDRFTPQDQSTNPPVFLPTSSVLSAGFGPDDRHVLAFSTFLVSQTDDRFSGEQTGASQRPGFDTFEFESAREDKDQLLYFGGTYALRLDPKWAVGITAFYARRSRSFTTRKALIDRSATQTRFIDVSNHASSEDGALLARIGVFWQPDDSVAFGLSCSTRSVRLHGTGDVAYLQVATFAQANPDVVSPQHRVVSEKGVDTETVQPWGCRVGTALHGPRWTLTTDVSVWVPVDHERHHLPTRVSSLRVASLQLRSTVEGEPVVNGAVGLEYRGEGKWPVRFGAFTNRSAAPDIPEVPAVFGASQINSYGVTASLGHRTKKTTLNFGAEFQFGTGEDVVFDDLESLISNPRLVEVDRTQWRLLFFLSGAVEFVKTVAKAAG